ncbi:MAG: nitroreductase family protein [Clostridiales bacterium]|jgi:nitroreductase/NAD-dependent dihydropyrimidine dehydrogenase PreA subunit|nr:nitroreductase family protein [Clostridiales bacterium]
MVTIEQSKCIGCGACVYDCVAGNLKLEGGKAKSGGQCILCGHCVAICPAGAVSIPEYEMGGVEEYDENRFGFDINNLLHTIKFRRSIRQYKNQLIEQDKLENIIQAGRYTATGSNSQACQFVIVQGRLPEFKEIIWDGLKSITENPSGLYEELIATFKNFTNMKAQGTDYLFRNSPALIYIAAENTIDAGLAAQNMELAAISQGLGMLYNGFLVYAASMLPSAREWLAIKDKPIATCMLVGYPKVGYKRTAPRRAANARIL